MLGLKSLLAAASLVALTVAQQVAFTSVPAVVVAGDSYNITWGGGDGTPVTLTLRQGNPQDLSTIATIADNVSGNNYVWTVATSLTSASDYALQITQGQSDINYSGLFTVSGGTGTSSASGTATTTSANATAPITASNATVTSTTMSSNSTMTTHHATTTNSNSFSFGAATTTGSATSSATATQSTSAPSNDAPVKVGSSAALIFGIVAAVMLH